MESTTLDIEPVQIIHWLKSERQAGRNRLQVAAFRAYEVTQIAERELAGLGDEDREELTEVLEVGLLEIRSPPGRAPWTLRMRFEDDIGARLPEDEPVPEGEEEIDLQTFYDSFIDPPRGAMEVSVETESPASKRAFAKVLNAILCDTHGR